MRYLITGGAGFIGKSLLLKLIEDKNNTIYNLDKLTYASDINLLNKFLKINDYSNYQFLKVDLANELKTFEAVEIANPDKIIHFAAESHVDKSITNPSNFIQSNIIGTFNLLEASRNHYESLNSNRRTNFRFHHISTDEVFGSIDNNDKFHEKSRYDPRSPYSASKASSDHLVRSWFHTYGLPILITNCSNNYGPGQFEEKLIPTIITKIKNNQTIPVYGDGQNIRDWLFIDDHIEAIIKVLNHGNVGDTFCIGGFGEMTNLKVVHKICDLLDKKLKRENSSRELITFVKDRLGHDKRYAIDSTKIRKELNWRPKYSFDEGIKITINWYLKNK